MTDTETKALKLLNDCGGDVLVVVRNGNAWVEALCRAIEQHEAFRQEVSDVVEEYIESFSPPTWHRLEGLIIPAPKPDPLLAALLELELSSDIEEGQHDAKWLRIKLDKLGFEIKEKSK